MVGDRNDGREGNEEGQIILHCFPRFTSRMTKQGSRMTGQGQKNRSITIAHSFKAAPVHRKINLADDGIIDGLLHVVFGYRLNPLRSHLRERPRWLRKMFPPRTKRDVEPKFPRYNRKRCFLMRW